MKWNPFKREQRTSDPSWQALSDRGALSTSGPYVDAKAAESISTVFACVQALSESTACLPLHVYERGIDERTRSDDHPLARVLRQPNDHQSGLAFRESMTAAVLLHGNAYARVDRNGAGELTALHPINPRSVTVIELDSGRYRYDYADNKGRVHRLLDDEVFHLADRTDAGSIVGKSRIQVARETLGLSLSLREHGASTFANGAQPGGLLTFEGPQQLKADQRAALRDAWESQHRGGTNAGRIAVLSGNMKYTQLGLSNEDAQWLASQQFSVEEICRIFRVPPTMVGDLRHGNYSNTAELGGQFVRYSLARWVTVWETEISRQLLGPIARRRYLAEHSVEGLLRGNPEARADYYGKAIKDGWMTVDEVRRLENLPKLAKVDEQQNGP